MYPSYAIPYRLIGLPVREFAQALARPFLGSLLMVAVVLAAQWLLGGLLSSVWLLAVLVVLGGLAYLLATWLFNRVQMLELLRVARAGM
jgi:PST family polysaccharide transporter